LGIALLASLYLINNTHFHSVTVTYYIRVTDTGKERTKKIAQSYTFAPYFAFNSKFPPV